MSPIITTRDVIRGVPAGATGAPWGKVYSVAELAREWQLSESSIRKIFADEPGVFVLGDSNPRRKRGYCTLRIPEGVALRVWKARGGQA